MSYHNPYLPISLKLRYTMKNLAKTTKRLSSSFAQLTSAIPHGLNCGNCGIYQSATMKRYGG